MKMGDIIKQERLKNNLTMEELGEKLGVGKSAINKWEKGLVENIKRPTILKMAEIFGVSPAYLMGIEEFDTPEDFEKRWRDLGGGRHPIELTDEEYNLIIEIRAAKDPMSLKRIKAYIKAMKEVEE